MLYHKVTTNYNVINKYTITIFFKTDKWYPMQFKY